jgi:phosphatidylethanolamine-binding protein (PEBP) family uncharacterized protein
MSCRDLPPAAGNGRHHYFFRLCALDSDPDLPPEAIKGELEGGWRDTPSPWPS